jgi:prophage regulatory protein
MESLLRLPAVRQRVGLSRSQIYELVRRGQFPAPVKLSERASGWQESLISEWVNSRIRASQQPAVAIK